MSAERADLLVSTLASTARLVHRAGEAQKSAQDEEGTEEEEGRSLQVRGRDPSRHRQVEAVRLEEQMGGAFVTQRRRSPRRSPSGSLEALSPLVSEEELSTIQPLIHCPSRQGGPGKFLSKVTRRDRPPCENSDSDTDQSENSAKDTA
ncbi:transcription initiation factor TFIID subunit 6 [Platysternon megacephalum]|uniref:Transcription initiation factor TFIID subunit 6 n=1 Tax=Platysternon megacephalum TaxID=55544 RepID=A0A4D9DN86_9SAUR|nr:transcription initiation factor TFIID subunit 6 [Platysternon megacephalum]